MPKPVISIAQLAGSHRAAIRDREMPFEGIIQPISSVRSRLLGARVSQPVTAAVKDAPLE